jgi:hypothetical protein
MSGRLADVIALPTSPDLRVLLIALVAAGKSLVFGYFPRFTPAAPTCAVLVEGTGGVTGPSPMADGISYYRKSRSASCSLSAGLLLRTFNHLTQLRSGVDATNVVTGTMSLQDARYRTSESINTLFTRSLERIARLPGVEHAAVALSLPYERPLNNGWRFDDEPGPLREPSRSLT